MRARLGVAVAVLWLMLPFVPLVLWAGADRWSFPSLLPQEWGARGWREAAAAGLGPALLRSVVLAAAVTVVVLPLGLAAGRALAWGRLHRPRLVVAVLLLPVLLPPFAIALGLDLAVLRLGVPAPVAVTAILATTALPYATYTCAAGFAGVSVQVEQQARVLGATARQAWWRAVLPAVRRSAAVAALLAFLVGWSDYVVTLMVGGGRLVTAPILLGSAASAVGNEPTVAVIAVAMIALPFALTAATVGRRAVRSVVR